jgi:bifunctional enzyme CysN/CysC
MGAAARGHGPELLRLATAGDAQDGKSTLIGRLLREANPLPGDQGEGLDLARVTDGLRAERERGGAVDVAWRHLATPRRRFIIADTPGAERYTRNMATGASTADLALILVDAQRGVLTQTRRHGFIAALLGVPHVVVAVNKMDLAGWSQEAFEAVREEYNDFAARLAIRDLSYVPVSALHGDNVARPGTSMPWYRGVPLLTHLESIEVVSDRNLVDLRFPVQRAVRPHRDFHGCSGTVASGVVRPGDAVTVLPGGRRTRVRRILGFERELDRAFPPLAVTLELEDHVDVERGDMLAHPNNVPRTARELEAMLVWMDDAPLRAGRVYLLKHATSWVRAAVSTLRYRVNPNTLHREEASQLRLNEIGRATLQLFKPVFCDDYRKNRQTGSFILVDPDTRATAAAGMIVERAVRAAPAAEERAASTNISWHASKVAAAERQKLLGQRPATVWLTGLSAAGKSSLAFEIERRLLAGGRACYVLDGDNVRHGLSRDLDFSPAARAENIRRVAEVAKLFNDAGLIVVTAFISPYREDRELARRIVGADRFVEVFVDAPLEVCERRDPRGLYRRARAGEIGDFTGVSAPYEPPEAPQLRVPTDRLDMEAAAALLYDYVAARCFGT